MSSANNYYGSLRSLSQCWMALVSNTAGDEHTLQYDAPVKPAVDSTRGK